MLTHIETRSDCP